MKRFIALVIGVAIVLTLSSCNGKENNDDTSSVADIKANDSQITSSQTIEVVDALNYKKDIIVTPENKEFGWDPNGLTHVIKLPKITSNTNNAQAFNKKLFDVFSKPYEILKNNQEKEQVYECNYEYKIYNGIIGIVIEAYVGAQAAGATSWHFPYYYDTKNDKELTYDEYLKALNLSKDVLEKKVVNTKTYKDHYENISEGNNVYVIDCILDTKGSIVYLNDNETMDGWTRLDMESLIDD